MDGHIVDMNRVNAAVKIKIGLMRIHKRIDGNRATPKDAKKVEKLTLDLRRIQDKMTCHEWSEYQKRVA